MRKLIIADIQSRVISGGQCVGHYMSLASQYTNMLANSFNVKVAGGIAYASMFNHDQLIVLPHNVGIYASRFINLVKICLNARALCKKTKGQIVVLQSGFPFSNHIAVLFFLHSCSLFLIEYSTAGIDAWYKKLVFRFLRNKVMGVICPNEDVGRAFDLPYLVIPDYVYHERNYSHNHISFDKRKYDFCLIGRISPEKGILEAARKLAKTCYKVIIAGLPQTQELEDELKSICVRASNIVLCLEYVSPEMYSMILRSSKYTLLNYSDEYSERSSGVVFDSVFNNTPVIGRRCRAFQMVEDAGTGFLFGNLNDINFTNLFDLKVYSGYIENIAKYQSTNNQYIARLTNFLEKFS